MPGLAAWVVGRAGVRPRLSLDCIFRSILVVICLTEVIAASLGAYSYLTGRAVFPEDMYPDLSRNLVTTQTIQLTCYLVAFVASGLMLYCLNRSRNFDGSRKN